MNSKKIIIGATLIVSTMLLSSINSFATYCSNSEGKQDCIEYTGSNVTSKQQENSDVYLVQLTGEADEDFIVRSTDKVILDLNGKKLTNYSTGCATIVIENGGELTIKDSKGGGEITQKEGTNGVETIVNHGNLTIESGKITNITKSANLAVVKNDTNGTVVVKGGTITGANECLQNMGTATISGGTIAGTGNFYSVRNEGTMTVSGDASITGTSNTTSVVGNIKNAGTKDPELTINSGKISGNNTGVINHNGTTVIKAGDINSVAADGGTITITGGKFETDVTKFLGSGVIQDENGNVVEKPTENPSNDNEEEEEEQDDTPKMGTVNVFTVAGAILVVSALGVVVLNKRK